MKHAPSSAQNGSAFFIILIAIAIFAMLSYALSKGSRMSASTLTADQAKLAAEEILSYTDTVRKAVQSLRLRGCTENQISFETPDTPEYNNPTAPADKHCHVFDIAGGKGIYRPMQLSWIKNNNPHWWFNGETPVQNIGTPAPELLMWSTNIKPEICAALNKLVIGKAPEFESVGTQTAGFNGTYVAVADNVGDDTNSIYAGQSTGCSESPTNSTFYAVMLVR